MGRMMTAVVVAVMAVAVASTAQAVEIVGSFVSSYATAQPEPDGHDIGIFRIDVDVVAIGGDDVYLKGILSDSEVAVKRNGVTTETPGVSHLFLATDGQQPSDLGFWFHLPEGQERRFMLLTSIVPPSTGFYSMELLQLNWSTTPGIGPGCNTPLGNEFNTPTIALRAVPEPATLALFAPVAVLLRRRRRF